MNAKSLYDHLIEAGAAGPALDACRRFSRHSARLVSAD